ncbi:MAG: hypothetical protein US16_C0063G0005 [Candidatus Moranbacteria bacterium GW2011_GWE2_36_40]|nr:MAG: hypothetical protein US16_C0063G0005 [Candidatus Moranbacteria bacterium GW2011_GWE2_36_40]
MKTLLKRGLWLIVTVCIAIFGVSFFVNNVLADEEEMQQFLLQLDLLMIKQEYLTLEMESLHGRA